MLRRFGTFDHLQGDPSGWFQRPFDLSLGSSGSWWVATVATKVPYCPDKMAELSQRGDCNHPDGSPCRLDCVKVGRRMRLRVLRRRWELDRLALQPRLPALLPRVRRPHERPRSQVDHVLTGLLCVHVAQINSIPCRSLEECHHFTRNTSACEPWF